MLATTAAPELEEPILEYGHKAITSPAMAMAGTTQKRSGVVLLSANDERWRKTPVTRLWPKQSPAQTGGE